MLWQTCAVSNLSLSSLLRRHRLGARGVPHRLLQQRDNRPVLPQPPCSLSSRVLVLLARLARLARPIYIGTQRTFHGTFRLTSGPVGPEPLTFAFLPRVQASTSTRRARKPARVAPLATSARARTAPTRAPAPRVHTPRGAPPSARSAPGAPPALTTPSRRNAARRAATPRRRTPQVARRALEATTARAPSWPTCPARPAPSPSLAPTPTARCAPRAPSPAPARHAFL